MVAYVQGAVMARYYEMHAHDFQRYGPFWGVGSTAVWNLCENSSDLVAWPVPQTCMTTRAFFKVCLVLIFLTTIVEKHVPRILKKFPLRSILMPKGLYEFETIPPSPFWKKGNNKTTKDWQCGASQRGIEPFSPSIPPQLHDAMKQSKPFVIHAAVLIQCGIMWLTFAENVILCSDPNHAFYASKVPWVSI